MITMHESWDALCERFGLESNEVTRFFQQMSAPLYAGQKFVLEGVNIAQFSRRFQMLPLWSSAFLHEAVRLGFMGAVGASVIGVVVFKLKGGGES